jgi:hypothetical protein
MGLVSSEDTAAVIIMVNDLLTNYSLMIIHPFLTFTCIYHLLIYAISVHLDNIRIASYNHHKEVPSSSLSISQTPVSCKVYCSY